MTDVRKTYGDLPPTGPTEPLPQDSILKQLVTQFPCLNIRFLAKGKWLRPRTRYEWVWRDKERKLRDGVAVLALKHTVVVIYRGDRQAVVKERLLILYSIGGQGATRPWFQCPQCMRRVGLLYKAAIGFRCRRCCDLKYESQYPSRGWSYGRRWQYLGEPLNCNS